jgi:hypothetical protein
MLPVVVLQDGVTIVIIPKIILQEDIADRYYKEGIRCAI